MPVSRRLTSILQVQDKMKESTRWRASAMAEFDNYSFTTVKI